MIRQLASIEVQPYHLMRYPSCGDWQISPRSGKVAISVAELGNEDYEFLIGLHELVEVWLCKKAGIPDEEVTAFDIDFENRRVPGNTDEPGDDPASPYRHEHRIATIVEMIVADAMGTDWRAYEKAVNSL